MKNSFLVLLCFFGASLFAQQKFVPDGYGHADDAEFAKLIKERGYELVGGFAPVDNDSILYYARVVKGGKWGFIDVAGNEVIAPQYDAADDFSEGIARTKYYIPGAKEPGIAYTMGFINSLGQPVGKRYDKVGTASYGLADVVQNSLHGVIGLNGKEVIAPLYREIKLDNTYIFVKNEWYYAVFDHSGRQLSGFDYSQGYSQFDFLFARKQGKIYVLDNTTGKPLTDEKYDESCFGAKGLDVLGVNNFKDYFLINADGKRVSDYYQRITAYAHGHFIVTKNGAFGVIDTTGREVIPCLYNRLEISKDGQMFTAYKDGAFTYFNRNYEPVDFSAYSRVERFINGFVYVEINGLWGFADYKGARVIAPCTEIAGFGFDDNGLAITSHYINDDERNGTDVRDGGTLSGIINLKGEVIVPPVYKSIWQDEDKYGMIGKDGKKGMLDATGNIRLPAVYDELSLIKGAGGLVRVSNKGHYGIVNLDNRVIVPLKYAEVGQYINSNGLIAIKKGDDLGGYVDLQGKIVVPPKYYTPDYDVECGIIKIYNDDYNYLADMYGNMLNISWP
ncbi:MAG: WG repeat-containing protein [Bacteroidota bacterium]